MSIKNVGLICGGRSAEREISIMSAESVMNALKGAGFNVDVCVIDKKGIWNSIATDDADDLGIIKACQNLKLTQVSPLVFLSKQDFIFPVLHGLNGEDGTMQGLLEILNVPYAGSGVLGSAVGMDKVMAKDIMTRYGIPTCDYMAVTAVEIKEHITDIVDEAVTRLGDNIFVKPSNSGSSIGITKVSDREELRKALKDACLYDRRILIEKAVQGRELETAVIGNDAVEVATVGEIVAKDMFYSFDLKYGKDSGTRLVIPAEIDEKKAREIQEIARRTFIALDLRGYSRIDFFMERNTNKVLVNEVNTIPGFTQYSLFPRVWKAKGYSFEEIVKRIVELGYEEYNSKNNRKTV